MALGLWLLGWALTASGQGAGAASGGPPAAAASATAPAPVRISRDTGRLRAAQLGLVINEDDPYSVAVGQYYQAQRGLAPSQVLRVRLPRRPRLSADEFGALRQQIDGHFGAGIQALALAWREPFAVDCHAITGALALGLHPEACRRSCDRTPGSAVFNHPGTTPLQSAGFRLSMLLAAPSESAARALIDRGVAADGRLGRMFGDEAVALFVHTSDAARNVRAPWFPEPGYLLGQHLAIRRLDAAPDEALRQADLVLLQTGAARLGDLSGLGFLPGALADHLTSFGGVLDGSSGQSSAMAWIAAGATASHGTVSEPCNHLQKFPFPPLLLGHYLQGVTAVEAYWKSVAWPLQSLFIGEPLAAPFARDAASPPGTAR